MIKNFSLPYLPNKRLYIRVVVDFDSSFISRGFGVNCEVEHVDSVYTPHISIGAGVQFWRWFVSASINFSRKPFLSSYLDFI